MFDAFQNIEHMCQESIKTRFRPPPLESANHLWLLRFRPPVVGRWCSPRLPPMVFVEGEHLWCSPKATSYCASTEGGQVVGGGTDRGGEVVFENEKQTQIV